jgi:hypothetical protein
MLGGGVVVALLLLTWCLLGASGLNKLVVGADGRTSLSKFQMFLWTIIVIGSYVAVLYLRSRAWPHLEDYRTLADIGIPPNLMLLMGFSLASTVASKAITSAQVASGSVVKQPTDRSPELRDLILDDKLQPDIAKAQMFWWTLVAAGIYVAALTRVLQVPALHLPPPGSLVPDNLKDYLDALKSLPDVGEALMVLMGVSQGVYIGGKLVTTNTPVLSSIVPNNAPLGEVVELRGGNFGDLQGGSRVLFGTKPAAVREWGSFLVKAQVPEDLGADKSMVSVVVNGYQSEPLPFTVAPRIEHIDPPQGPPETPVTIVGSGFGERPADDKSQFTLWFGNAPATVSEWRSTSLKAIVPKTTAGKVDVHVNANGGQSNKWPFAVVAADP